MRRFVVSVVVLAVLVGGGYAGWHYWKKSPSTSGPTSSTTTSTVASPIAPLTGLPDPNGRAQQRPALTVKIENIPAAMPQQGIDQADVIYEEIVEGGITRLAAIFNSKSPPIIGPIRSVRRTDHSIVWPIGGIFAYSGGAAYAVASIETAPVHIIDEDAAGAAMYRDNDGRIPPNNLYGIGSRLFALGGTPISPPPLFTYRAANASVPGVRVKSFVVGFGSGYTASYVWDQRTLSWDRTNFVDTSYAAPDFAADGVRISPKNVIVEDVNYLGGVGTLGAQAQMIGTGHVTVFTDGHEIVGTWSRTQLTQPTQYLNAQGQPIALTPGQTWVELLYVGDPLSSTPVPTTTTTTKS